MAKECQYCFHLNNVKFKENCLQLFESGENKFQKILKHVPGVCVCVIVCACMCVCFCLYVCVS